MAIYNILAVRIEALSLFQPLFHLPSLSHRKLSHPKLVQLYGVCFENTPICLVFEFMENGCLSDYLRSQRGSFSKETLLGMCQDVCEGMAYLEQNSVIHRDLVRWSHIDFFSAPAGLFPVLSLFLNFSFHAPPACLLTGDAVPPLTAEAASIF